MLAPVTMVVTAVTLAPLLEHTVEWLRSDRHRRERTAGAFIMLGVVALFASGLWVEGWWSEFLLNAGVGFLFVGIIDTLVMSSIERTAPAGPDLPVQHEDEVG